MVCEALDGGAEWVLTCKVFRGRRNLVLSAAATDKNECKNNKEDKGKST